ncbi:hypothetical protein C5B85_10730 [Pseudoclavibacter sp. AY1F1]|uniref:hypothetical protein n=1 Tax=Pseudoclavibacter sp. AY1F1 TaxID=2080583 RepID=UPI000CE7DAC1|nr:hypothetical protein [Pseudoclavibacter sp. AY1F1]PPF44112.1 hypothetical protein C5B85_10730 [Pseudoclavibacter sp. AY1F1]
MTDDDCGCSPLPPLVLRASRPPLDGLAALIATTLVAGVDIQILWPRQARLQLLAVLDPETSSYRLVLHDDGRIYEVCTPGAAPRWRADDPRLRDALADTVRRGVPTAALSRRREIEP